jgi:hypothetical protein
MYYVARNGKQYVFKLMQDLINIMQINTWAARVSHLEQCIYQNRTRAN